MRKLLGMVFSLLSLGVVQAHSAPCVDIALVIAIDGSGSISDDEFVFQKQAIASAMRDPEVNNALQAAGIVALSALFWGDGEFPPQEIGWHVAFNGDDTELFARMVEQTPRAVFGNTDIGSGIWTALNLLSAPEICAARSIINLSGDGRETIAPKRRQIASLQSARRRATEMGVTINALTVSDEIPDLADYFERSVITGVGSFVMDIRRSGDFATALKRKLIREISPGAVAAAHEQARWPEERF